MPRVQLPAVTPKHNAWNKGRIMGQKRPLRCCQTNENSHQIAGAALIYALNSWRRSCCIWLSDVPHGLWCELI